jgi:hypothetical protein
MDAIEAELARLTARTEEIELRLNRVVTDGTNRIGDIEFRLCEATEGCDPMNMPETAPLGGDTGRRRHLRPNRPPPTPRQPPAGPELAVGEQADFDRAKEVLGQGDFRGAADALCDLCPILSWRAAEFRRRISCAARRCASWAIRPGPRAPISRPIPATRRAALPPMRC